MSAPPADAAYPGPGPSGRIAFERDGAIWSMANLSDQSQVTPGTFAIDSQPVWSPDGTRVAFVRTELPPCTPCQWAVYADGTGEIPSAGPTSDQLASPTWAPSGQKIAFTRLASGQWDIWTVNTDRTDLRQITDTPAREGSLTWSPAGDRIAFDQDENGIFSVDPDGTDRETIIPSESSPLGPRPAHPDFSPDGTAIAYQEISDCGGTVAGVLKTRKLDGSGGTAVYGDPCAGGPYDPPSWTPGGARIFSSDGTIFGVGVDGTNPQTTFVAGRNPDVQPRPENSFLGGYVRPIGATPFRVPLVPTARECTAPTRTHGPPLAFPSCNPVQPGSTHLTVGSGDGSPALARSSGFVRIEVLVGVPGAPEDADVGLRFSLTNVMRVADRSEYTGQLKASFTARHTDIERFGPLSGQAISTTYDFPFSLVVPCVPTADPLDAATCQVATTFDALQPGAVEETERAMWELGRVEVYDAGPDEDATTDNDNSLFMTQGVFVP